MAYEPGGYADKLGNRYEGRWVVRQLLRVLLEELTSVTVEAVGDHQDWVDLVVTKKNGQQQFQQCKARNASKEFWTVGDLKSRGILQAIRSSLGRSDDCEFALVTGVPATVFGDICESARKSSGDPEEFYQHQIKKIGEPRRKTFREFCEYLALDPDKASCRAGAFDLLRRTHIILRPDDLGSQDELRTLASMLVTGDAQAVVAVLSDFAQDTIRKTLDVRAVREYLGSKGLHPRTLAADVRIAPQIEELQRRFHDSISSG